MKKSGPKGLFFIFPKVGRERSSPMQRSKHVNYDILLKPHKTITFATPFYYNINIFGT